MGERMISAPIYFIATEVCSVRRVVLEVRKMCSVITFLALLCMIWGKSFISF